MFCLSNILGIMALSGLLTSSPEQVGSKSVVKIYVTIQQADYTLPWQSTRPGGGTGSGFVISKRRILTNAHIVSDARFIEVQRNTDPKRYPAKVSFVGHDCDLAILDVEDDEFFAGTQPVQFAEALPKLSDEVTVLGYPLGGTRLSATRGIVSRIDYNTYFHAGVDEHLVLQVDAAINPGNSGGPVMYKGKVVGLAFQGISMAQNIGYAIPMPVIRHFLQDVEDGAYNGYPELGAAILPIRNAALRKECGLSENQSGAVVWFVDPYGAAKGLLQPRDVLLSIDGYRIADDGTVNLNGNNVIFSELLERKQWGESAKFSVWRDRKAQEIVVPLRNPHDPFIFRTEYDEQPEFYVTGGLVFAPLTQRYLAHVAQRIDSANEQQLIYCRQFVKLDNLCEGRKQFVVFIRRLPHAVNAYTEEFMNGIVAEVNGRRIGCLKDIKNAFEERHEGFHLITFEGTKERLMLDVAAVERANDEISRTYGVTVREYIKDESK